MPRTLHGKALLILVVLLCSMALVSFFLMKRSSDLYQQGLDQALNERLATTLAQSYLAGAGDAHDIKARAREHFANVMSINPGIELYLLDSSGAILAFTAPAEEVVRKRVDLEPLRAFIEGAPRYPLLGDDPKDLFARQTFSAAPVDPSRPELGYLYVVLGGANYAAIARRMEGGQALRDAVITFVPIVVVALIGGAIVLLFLTRKLRRLTECMTLYQNRNFADPVFFLSARPSGGDEIEQLGQTYNAMVEHIDRQMRELARTDAARRDLIAAVAHDLRTPLAALRGYLETLLLRDRKLSDEERRSFIEIAIRQGDHLTHLVSELFELAKLDSDDAQINAESFQLTELVQDVLQKLKLKAASKGVALDARINGEVAFALGDIGLIERVLINLIDNAIRHTEKEGWILVEVSQADSRVEVAVQDSGEGIAEADLPHVFHRFYRSDQSRGADHAGAGLGLAIAKRIIDLHQGRIGVKSERGVGTTFTFTLPVASTLTG